MTTIILALLVLLVAYVLLLLPWLVLGLEVGFAACNHALARGHCTLPVRPLLLALLIASLISACFFPSVAFVLVALVLFLPGLAILVWALAVWVRGRNFRAFDPLLCRYGIRRSWLALSLVVQAVLGFLVWFAFIRNASQSTHDEILRICQAIPGVKSVEIIGSTNDNLFGDHGFTIELTLNYGGQLGLAGPLWPEDLDFSQGGVINLYRIGNFTFEDAEVRPGLSPERAMTYSHSVSVGNFTDGLFPFAVTSLTNLVAHYDQLVAIVSQWPVAPSANLRTIQRPDGPVDYYYALHPSDVPSDVDIPLQEPGPK